MRKNGPRDIQAGLRAVLKWMAPAFIGGRLFTRIVSASLAMLLLAHADIALSDTRSVAIRGLAFVPSALTAAVGEAVIWTNEDPVLHSILWTQGRTDASRPLSLCLRFSPVHVGERHGERGANPDRSGSVRVRHNSAIGLGLRPRHNRRLTGSAAPDRNRHDRRHADRLPRVARCGARDGDDNGRWRADRRDHLPALRGR